MMTSRFGYCKKNMAGDDKSVCIKDLRPGMKNVTCIFIVIDKGTTNQTKDGSTVRKCRVGDRTGSVCFSLWNEQAEAIEAGDILKLTRGYASLWKGGMMLYSGKYGKLEKIGEFTMVFSELPDMSDPTHEFAQQYQKPQAHNAASGGGMRTTRNRNGNNNATSAAVTGGDRPPLNSEMNRPTVQPPHTHQAHFVPPPPPLPTHPNHRLPPPQLALPNPPFHPSQPPPHTHPNSTFHRPSFPNSRPQGIHPYTQNAHPQGPPPPHYTQNALPSVTGGQSMDPRVGSRSSKSGEARERLRYHPYPSLNHPPESWR